MANIRPTLRRTFTLSDLRLKNVIEERGANYVLSPSYSPEEARERNFYSPPQIARDQEDKLAIIYGEVLISPFVQDLGEDVSPNGSGGTVKTIVFRAGEGETEGVVIGPNGSLLENVYIGQGDKTPEPVIDSDGRPSTKDVVLASSIGPIAAAIPGLWRALQSESEDEIEINDPVTGKPVKSPNEKAREKELEESTFLDDLADVEAREKQTGSVLMYNACEGDWTSVHITDVLRQYVDIDGATGGSGGAGGAGGDGGSGGAGGDPGVPEGSEPAPEFEPDTDLSKPADNTPTPRAQPGMAELPDISETLDNEWREQLNITGTTGLQLHFWHDGNESNLTWSPSNGAAGGDNKCFSNPNTPNNPNELAQSIEGNFIIYICISATICGEEVPIYEAFQGERSFSETGFSRAHPWIEWENTKLGELITLDPDAVPDTVTLRLRRVDGGAEDGTPQSVYSTYFQGKSFRRGELPQATQRTKPPEQDEYPEVTVRFRVPDDDVTPEQGPSGALGPDTCPVPPVSPEVPATPGAPGQPGEPADEGEPPEPGESGTVDVGDAPGAPSFRIETPCARTYSLDENGQGSPVSLAPLIRLSSGIADTTVTLQYRFLKGDAVFSTSQDPIPGVSISGRNSRNMEIIGSEEDVLAASESAVIIPADGSRGKIIFQYVISNTAATTDGAPFDECAGLACEVSPEQVIITESESACANISFDLDTNTQGTVAISIVDTDGISRDLTSEPVPKVQGQSPADFMQDIVDNIDANVQDQNQNQPVGSLEWLPLFEVSVEGTDTITLCAPAAGGDEFNDFQLNASVVGVDVDPGRSVLGMIGGALKSAGSKIKNLLPSGEVAGILAGVAGQIAGSIIANHILSNSSKLSITMPEEDYDRDTRVSFLYRGRKVRVPQEYDAFNRTGATTFENFSGDWKEAWTNNPAWCLLDFIENRVYGLGKEVVLSPAQKERLLQDIFDVAIYADDVIEGQPRYSLNTVIVEGTKVEILEQICSNFHGSYVFSNGLRIRYDGPDTLVTKLVTQANANDFTYEHTTLKSLANRVNVTYQEPDALYNDQIISVENNFAVETYGEQELDVVAFGVTSELEARRYARWILETELDNSLFISYLGGWDHYDLVPGDIVQFEDSLERGVRRGGRIVSLDGAIVTLDSETDAAAGDTISLTNSDGTIIEREILSVDGVEITIDPTDVDALPTSVFIVRKSGTPRQLFKLIKIEEQELGQFATVLQRFSPDKYNRI